MNSDFDFASGYRSDGSSAFPIFDFRLLIFRMIICLHADDCYTIIMELVGTVGLVGGLFRRQMTDDRRQTSEADD
jgi:hypothetical protein